MRDDAHPSETAMTDLPVIDVGPLLTGDPEGSRQAAAALGAACRRFGFFYITGHAVPASVTEGLLDAARRFFALPEEVKRSVSIERSRHNRGYVGLGSEALDETQPPDRKEAFNIGLDLPPDDPEVLANRPFRGPNQWPDLPGLRQTALDYYDRMRALGMAVHRGFALDLGLAPDFFTRFFDRPLATLRLLHYPASPAPAVALGAGAHTDYGNLTLLLTDGVPGLEIRRRDGDWIAAPHVEGTFVCNIGDLLMRWSNGVYVSTPHRVRITSGRERYSVAFFLDPDPEARVECLPSCTGPDRPPRWPPITAGAYLTQRLDATYAFRRDG